MNSKIVLAGGSGFIGRALAKRFLAQGDRVVILGRGKTGSAPQAEFLHWDGRTPGDWVKTLEGADLLINLAGKSVDGRYNEKNKKAILDSRVFPTLVLREAVQKAEKPPKLWINFSTATIYRHAEDRPMDDETGEIGSGFSVEVAKAWEKAFFDGATPRTRKVALRAAIVVGEGGGVWSPLKTLVRWGLGGTQGNGRQMFSWIHEEDLFGIIRFVQSHGDITGTVNCSAPHPLPNRELMAAFRKVLHRPFGLPAPAWLLEIGAFLIRTETELLLKSRWVLSTRLEKAGYRFKHPGLPETLAGLVEE